MDRQEQKTETEAIEKEIQAIMEGGKKEETPGKKRRGSRKKAGKVLLLILLGGGLLFAGSRLLFGDGGGLPQVELGSLARGSITESLTVTGPVEGTDSVDVTSRLHARITELKVKEGDRVEAGKTVLARLDTGELQKEVEIAEGNYKLAAAQRDEKVKEDTEAWKKARQELKAAQEDYDRKAVLAQTGDISQVELSTAENSLQEAKRNVEAYRIRDGKVMAEDSMEIQVQNAELALEQTREKLTETTILAPISGTVTRVNTKVGQFADDIENNRPMITIENLDALQMEIKVSEYSIGKVSPGQEVRITADILGEGKSVAGEVMSISPTGEEKGGGSTERVIPTRIRITEPDTALIAGINAKAQIILEEASGVWTVPVSAVGEDGTGQAAMQFAVPKEDGSCCRIRVVPVETGLESDLELEVKGPVREEDQELFQEGSRYLSAYHAELSEGQEIQELQTGEKAAATGSVADGKGAAS